MDKKDIKQIIIALLGAGLFLLLVLIIKPQNYIKIGDILSGKNNPPTNGCPTSIICEAKDSSRCGTFSLRAPIIYIIKDNPVKEYYAILHTFWVSKKKFDRMQCYESEESAQAAGYQQSEQAKNGIAAFNWLNRPAWQRENYNPNSATNTSELLQKIDTVIGF